MESYPIDQLTPSALSDILAKVGGGMVQSIIIAAEIADVEGVRRSLIIWDNESTITSKLGLRDLMSLGLEIQAEMAICAFDDDEEEIEDD